MWNDQKSRARWKGEEMGDEGGNVLTSGSVSGCERLSSQESARGGETG